MLQFNKKDFKQATDKIQYIESIIDEGSINWELISIHQKLSEKFIRKFQDKVNWEWISQFQKLSENFIREFQDKVDWWYIIVYQNLSQDFITEMKLKGMFIKNLKENI